MKEICDKNIVFDLNLIKIFNKKYQKYIPNNYDPNMNTFIFPQTARKYIRKKYNINISKSVKMIWELHPYGKGVLKCFWKSKLWGGTNNIIVDGDYLD